MKKSFILFTFVVLFQLSSFAQKTLNDLKKIEQIHKIQGKDGSILTGADKGGINKKDGSPDMRFKANKQRAIGRIKADGSPDMRYKVHQKMNGTLNKRP